MSSSSRVANTASGNVSANSSSMTEHKALPSRPLLPVITGRWVIGDTLAYRRGRRTPARRPGLSRAALQVQEGADPAQVEREPVLDLVERLKAPARHLDDHPAALGVVAEAVTLVAQRVAFDVIRLSLIHISE